MDSMTVYEKSIISFCMGIWEKLNRGNTSRAEIGSEVVGNCYDSLKFTLSIASGILPWSTVILCFLISIYFFYLPKEYKKLLGSFLIPFITAHMFNLWIIYCYIYAIGVFEHDILRPWHQEDALRVLVQLMILASLCFTVFYAFITSFDVHVMNTFIIISLSELLYIIAGSHVAVEIYTMEIFVFAVLWGWIHLVVLLIKTIWKRISKSCIP